MNGITRTIGATFFTLLVGFAVAMCGSLAPSVAVAEVIFDSIDFDNQTGSWGGTAEVGSEVELAGSDRVVTMVEFVIVGVSSPRNVQLAIYAMDGPGGEPGTVLGKSNYLPAPMSEKQVLKFDFDNVVVPDRITVTMNDDIPPGIPGTGGLFSPASVGGFVTTWHQPGTDVWRTIPLPADAVMMRIHAVPEPSVAVGLCLLTAVLFSRRRIA